MEVLNVEGLASSVVREFLNRKKCKRTLEILDEELPRKQESINNRSRLARAMFLEKWMKNNKASSVPYKTMLEVIIYNIIEMNKPISELEEPQKSINRIQHDLSKAEPIQPEQPTTSYELGRSVRKHHNEHLFVENLEEGNSNNFKLTDVSVKPTRLAFEPEVKKHHKSRSQSSLTENGQVSSNTSFKRLNQGSDETVSRINLEENDEKIKSVLDMLSATPEKSLNSASKKHTHTFNAFTTTGKWSDTEPNEFTRKRHKVLPSDKSIPSTHHITKDRHRHVIFDYETAKELRMLLFGSVRNGFSQEWMDQNFSFDNCDFSRPDELRFGIVQKKGGPCGVLAAVQALVLKYMLFLSNETCILPSCLNVSDETRTSCLVEAITEILWRAGREELSFLAILSPRQQFTVVPSRYRPDGISEFVVLLKFASVASLRTAVEENIGNFELSKGGCILLLYSAILSHSIEEVRADMDEAEAKLMGAHGYCTQEMVNLLLIGSATSNAFDGDMHLDETTLLKGIHMQSDVGMLSLFEHYRSCEIGENYKTPKYPIWIVCSESHFSVLFCADKNVLSSKKLPSYLDLYYYDGLASQDEVIILTVDTIHKAENNEMEGDLIPPLEHCIRTKWPMAKINWNGTDPIL